MSSSDDDDFPSFGNTRPKGSKVFSAPTIKDLKKANEHLAIRQILTPCEIPEDIKDCTDVLDKNESDTTPELATQQAQSFFIKPNSLQYFSLRSSTLKDCYSTTSVSELSPLEKFLLTLKSDDIFELIHCRNIKDGIKNVNPFVNFLLKTMSLHVNGLFVDDSNTFLKNLCFKSDVHLSSENIFTILFNCTADVLQSDIFKMMPEVKAIPMLCTPDDLCPENWLQNLKYVLNSLDELLRFSNISETELCKVFIYLILMCVDPEFVLYFEIQQCLLTVLIRVSSDYWPINRSLIAMSLTTENISINYQQDYLYFMVKAIPTVTIKGCELQKYTSMIALLSFAKDDALHHSLEYSEELFSILNLKFILEMLLDLEESFQRVAVQLLELLINHLKFSNEEQETLCNLLKKTERSISKRYEVSWIQARLVRILTRLEYSSGPQEIVRILNPPIKTSNEAFPQDSNKADQERNSSLVSQYNLKEARVHLTRINPSTITRYTSISSTLFKSSKYTDSIKKKNQQDPEPANLLSESSTSIDLKMVKTIEVQTKQSNAEPCLEPSNSSNSITNMSVQEPKSLNLQSKSHTSTDFNTVKPSVMQPKHPSAELLIKSSISSDSIMIESLQEPKLSLMSKSSTSAVLKVVESTEVLSKHPSAEQLIKSTAYSDSIINNSQQDTKSANLLSTTSTNFKKVKPLSVQPKHPSSVPLINSSTSSDSIKNQSQHKPRLVNVVSNILRSSIEIGVHFSPTRVPLEQDAFRHQNNPKHSSINALTCDNQQLLSHLKLPAINSNDKETFRQSPTFVEFAHKVSSCIWNGNLILQMESNIPRIPLEKLPNSFTCSMYSALTKTGSAIISALTRTGSAEINADKWPKHLVVSFICNGNPNFLSCLEKNSWSILIDISQETETFIKLKKSLLSEITLLGLIKFPDTSDISTMLVLYFPDEKRHIGFIPHDQEFSFKNFKQKLENLCSQQQKQVASVQNNPQSCAESSSSVFNSGSWEKEVSNETNQPLIKNSHTIPPSVLQSCSFVIKDTQNTTVRKSVEHFPTIEADTIVSDVKSDKLIREGSLPIFIPKTSVKASSDSSSSQISEETYDSMMKKSLICKTEVPEKIFLEQETQKLAGKEKSPAEALTETLFCESSTGPLPEKHNTTINSFVECSVLQNSVPLSAFKNEFKSSEVIATTCPIPNNPSTLVGNEELPPLSILESALPAFSNGKIFDFSFLKNDFGKVGLKNSDNVQESKEVEVICLSDEDLKSDNVQQIKEVEVVCLSDEDSSFFKSSNLNNDHESSKDSQGSSRSNNGKSHRSGKDLDYKLSYDNPFSLMTLFSTDESKKRNSLKRSNNNDAPARKKSRLSENGYVPQQNARPVQRIRTDSKPLKSVETNLVVKEDIAYDDDCSIINEPDIIIID